MLGPLKHILILAHILAVLVIAQRDKIQPNIAITGKRLLLVTAHPDDEAMFFGPTINYARENNASIYLLCLSSGDAEGLGAQRSQELFNAAHILGIYPFNLTVVDSEKLPDNMEQEWKIEDILPFIDEAAQKSRPDVIVTFDEEGVSGHTNHKQTSLAVQKYIQESHLPAWLLNSVPLTRKYIGSIDVVPVIFKNGFKSLYFINGFEGHFRVFTAMTSGHQSQMKWFRYLWLLFSRYNYINDYSVVSPVRGFAKAAAAATATATAAAHEEL